MTAFQQTLDSLAIPAAFSRHDRLEDATILKDLDTWRSNTEPLLNSLDSSNIVALSIAELADLVRVLAPLTAVAPWSSLVVRSLASDHLAKISASYQLISHILTQVVKPIFAPTPHPRLHTSTARILPRSADVQDTYIEQPWKKYPGLDEVIRWCLLHTETLAYEKTWPLLLPPVMSFLDDYQLPYKILGVRLVSDMLAHVSSDLLLRTGVDTLLFTSLINSLSHLGDKSTSDFIHLSVATTLQLIDLTTPSASASGDISLPEHKLEGMPTATVIRTLPSSSHSSSLSIRFSRLSTLLSSSLLGTVIMYTPIFLHPASSSAPDSDPSDDLESHVHAQETSLPAQRPQKQSFNPTLVAAAQSLPPVLSALGIGCARFLKGIIHLLAEWLALPLPIIPAGEKDIALHLASLSILSVLFDTCAPRIARWSMMIADALGRCWVACLDVESQTRGDAITTDGLFILKKQLKKTAVQLAIVCPAVIKNEYAILLTSNVALFQGLIEDSISKTALVLVDCHRPAQML